MLTTITAKVPGLALVVALALVAAAVGVVVPLVGGAVAGVALGVLIAAIRRPGGVLLPGIRFASRPLLQLSIVLLGFRLSLADIGAAGAAGLPVLLVTLVVCLGGAYLLGRALGVVGELRTLIGVGTGICGASAIAAVTPVIGASGAAVAYAVSTIFLFNIAAVLVFPPLGHLLGMSGDAFGVFAGTAVNDMSSVVAAATTFGDGAVDEAVVVKLVRTLMIIPVCLALGAWVARRDRLAAAASAGTDPGEADAAGGAPGAARVLRLVPWFLVGFVLAAAVNSLGLVPPGVADGLAQVSVFLITMALTAIGLSTDLAGFRRAGPRPLLLGGLLWALIAVTSLGTQLLTGGFAGA